MNTKIQFVYSQFTALVMISIGLISADLNPGNWMLFALGGAISLLSLSQIKLRRNRRLIAAEPVNTQTSQ